MVRPQKSATSRACTAMVTLALTTGGMTAIVATPLSASAATGDTQLVVTDVTSADSQNLSAASLLTVNISGAKSLTKPIALPTADSASDKAFTLSGSSNGNGALARSADGNYLAIAGYNKVPGVTGFSPVDDPKDTTSAQIGRMVARISSTGVVNTSTLLGPSVFNKSAPRGVASANGSSFYVSGNGGNTGDSPISGVDKVDLGGDGKVQIAQTTQKNVRQIQIAGGALYATSDKGTLFGLGKFSGASLPTAATAITQLAPITTNVGGTPKPASDSFVPDALLMLDANSVPGIDTAYVVVDTDAGNGIPGEIRKYTSNGTAWTLAGSKTGDYPFLTGRVNAAGTAVQLYAAKSSAVGNTVVSFDDSSLTGTFTPGAETTLATAAAGHAFRGVSFAPAGWNPGTISSDAPTASVATSTAGGTVGDTHNPTSTVTLADTDTDAADLTLTAHSSNQGVVPDANISVTGAGLTRTVSYEPTARGRSTITFTVTDDNNNTGTAQVAYGASNAPPSATGRYLYESSDLSSAVDVGDGYSLAVSSEDNSIRLYKQGESGRPVYTYDFDGDIGSTTADIEGMARVNDMLYILGSHGNNSDGDLKPARRLLFTATLSGSGATTSVTYVGKFNGLWDDLRTWDQANGDRLGFAAGQADGKKSNDPNGFNIEGLEFAPGSTSTAYLGFRAPIITHAGKPSAVIVPLTNADKLVLGTATHGTFGDPIYLDLGGRTIRDIRKNSHDEYLISAQSDTGAPHWALFAWDGRANNKPILVKGLPDTVPTQTGSWESIVGVPHPLSSGGAVSSITDSGDTTYYGDATVGSDESKGLRKSYADDFTTSTFLAYPTTPVGVATTAGPNSVSVAWDAVSAAASYNVTLKNAGANAPGSPKAVLAGTASTFSGLDSTKTYAVTVTSVNASGESDSSEPLNATPDFVPVPITNNSVPTITGTAKVGSTLTAGDGTWTPSGTTYTYAWSADGTPIAGATAKTYDLTATEQGKTIAVTVTASKPTWISTSKTSTSTSAVAKGTITNNGVPTITGTVKVNSTVTATDGTWTPSVTSYTYAWSADGTPIAGATSNSYDLTSAEAGKKISVTVSASKTGYTSASASSAQTAAVALGTITNTTAPSISGTEKVGSKLTATGDIWTPSGTTSTYAWSADGTAILGATSKTYDLTAAELGKKITVTATASKATFISASKTSAQTGAIDKGTITNNGVPTISGTVKVGSTLTATGGSWTPSGTTQTYAWSADGAPIAGATAKTYDLTAAELGNKITVTETASRTGYTPETATSEATDVVDNGTIINTALPSITGTEKVGSKLTATGDTWTPSGTTPAYVWSADGTPISGATAKTYDLTTAELGTKIIVTVTASRTGFTSASKTSTPTGAIDKGTITNNGVPTITGTVQVDSTLTAEDGTWSPSGTTYTYAWSADGTPIAGATLDSYDLTSDEAGKKMSVTVSASKTGYTSTNASSAQTASVALGTITNTTAPSISGTEKVGSKLTATDGTWTPSGTTPTYAWSADGTPIGGATSDTYDLTAAELDKTITVTATASKATFISASKTSAQTGAIDKGTITNNGVPTITGTVKVGSTLTAGEGSWTPSGTTPTYAWSAGGTPIDGATAKTYDLTAAELGKTITVTVTASRTGYTPETATSEATEAVAMGTIANTGAPTISGTGEVGSTLTAGDGTWTPSGTTSTYAWSADGTPIDGATSNTYDLTAAELGKKITVTAAATKAGCTSETATSAPTATVVLPSVSNMAPPSIGATAVVGRQLSVTLGTWAPTGIGFDYQWLADGDPIAGATSSTFTPTAHELGKLISVRVTGSKDGLTSHDETTAVTSPVANAVPPFGTPTNFIATAQTSSTITLTWTKSTGATKYRISSGIGTGTRTKIEVGNTNTTTITGLKPKTKYLIDISALKTDNTQSGLTPRLAVTTDALRAPTNLTPTSRTASRIGVTWTKVPGVTKYRISWGIGKGKRSTLVVGDVSEATLVGLKRGKTYTISIASLSVDKKTASGYSPRISVKTSSLLPPTKFASSAGTSSTVTLTWKKASKAKHYVVGYGIGTGPRTKIKVGDVSTVRLTGLKSGTKYTIDIAALEGDGDTRSIYTSMVTFKTR